MINYYARNRRRSSLDDLYRIAEILDVEVIELLIERKALYRVGKPDNIY